MYAFDLLDFQMQQSCFYSRCVTHRYPNKQKRTYHFTNADLVYKNYFAFTDSTKERENFFQIGKTGDEPEPNLIEFYIKTFHKLNDSSQEILIVIYNYLEGY